MAEQQEREAAAVEARRTTARRALREEIERWDAERRARVVAPSKPPKVGRGFFESLALVLVGVGAGWVLAAAVARTMPAPPPTVQWSPATVRIGNATQPVHCSAAQGGGLMVAAAVSGPGGGVAIETRCSAIEVVRAPRPAQAGAQSAERPQTQADPKAPQKAEAPAGGGGAR